MRTLKNLILLLAIAVSPAYAQTVSASDSLNHIGEKATVCGALAGKHVATESKGRPTFLNLDYQFPNQSFTVLVWQRDKAKVGLLPSSGQICVTGVIVQYRGGGEIILHNAANWYVPKPQMSQNSQLSKNHYYTNSNGQHVHSPAYSTGGVPAGASALCADGTYSFSQHRSGTCSHHGGVAQWY